MIAHSPILEHVMNIAKQLYSVIPLETGSTLSVLFQIFITETISVEETREICYSLIEATAPIDKLHMILVKSKQLPSQAEKTPEITFLPIERSRKSPRIWKEGYIKLLIAIHKYEYES
jgi:hypothetical protein